MLFSLPLSLLSASLHHNRLCSLWASAEPCGHHLRFFERFLCRWGKASSNRSILAAMAAGIIRYGMYMAIRVSLLLRGKAAAAISARHGTTVVAVEMP